MRRNDPRNGYIPFVILGSPKRQVKPLHVEVVEK